MSKLNALKNIPIERPLGSHELLTLMIDQTAPWIMQTISVVKGHVEEIAVKNSLSTLQRKHPFLQVSLLLENTPRYIRCNAPIPYKIVDRNCDWRALSTKILNTPIIDASLPLINLHWVKSDDHQIFILSLSHIIADGISICCLARDFLSYCRKSQDTKFKPLEALPTFENLIPNPPTSTKINFDLTKIGKYKKKRSVAFLRHKFSIAKTNHIITTSRENQTTVHGFLSASHVIALYKLLKEQKIDTKEILSMTPINPRPLFKKTILPEDLCNYIAGAKFPYLIQPSHCLWSLSKSINDNVKKIVDSGSLFDRLRVEADLINQLSTPESLMDHIKFSKPTVCVSNVGIINIPEKINDLEIIDFYFLGNDATLWDAENSFCTIAYTFRNQLIIDFMYTTPTIKKHKAEKFKEFVLTTINENIKHTALV